MRKARKPQNKDAEIGLDPRSAKRWECLDMPQPFGDGDGGTSAASVLPREEKLENVPLAGPLYDPDGRLLTPPHQTPPSGSGPHTRSAVSRKSSIRLTERPCDDSVYDLVYKVPRRDSADLADPAEHRRFIAPIAVFLLLLVGLAVIIIYL